jgi:hypothetical protein
MRDELAINHGPVYAYSMMLSFIGMDPDLHGVCACRGTA